MRSISEKLGDAPPAIPEPKAAGLCEDELTLKLATPMMGGGVEAGEVDMARPIRASAIRGHLRHWWRLFCANGLKGDELRKAEKGVWGGTDISSRVIVLVECAPIAGAQAMRAHNAAVPFDFEARYGPELYALFPAQEQRQAGKPGHDIAREGLTFTLTLRYPRELQEQVRMALAAWIYFGGVGARTRRGCGSLACEAGGAGLPSLEEVLAANDQIAFWRGPEAKNGLAAWQNALKVYKDYRQSRNPGQDRRPGRSHWPEPDSIRQLTGCSAGKHSIPVADAASLPSFPRAALGLPIIFHFKDGPRGRPDPNRDPADVQLKGRWRGKERERMASPVITKGIYKDGEWYSAIVVLPRQAALELQPVAGTRQDSQIKPAQGRHYAKIRPMGGALDAISGLERFITSKGFEREEHH